MSRSVSDYKNLSPRSHVLAKPTMTIGSTALTPREELVYDFEAKKITKVFLSLPPAVERLFFEILVNAIDNSRESQNMGMEILPIEISMDNKIIRIKNYGLAIPLGKATGSDLYVPEMIFGKMHSSSNFSKAKREGGGTNGIGAKATNIFSSTFVVEIVSNGKKYVQKWKHNMRERNEPKITRLEEELPNSVTVTWALDFSQFKLLEQYDDESIALFARHAIDASFTGNIPVVFNGLPFDYRNIKKYAKLYFPEETTTAMAYYLWSNDVEEPPTTTKGFVKGPKPEYPIFECLFLDTPKSGTFLSFVNSILTRDGGLHVDAAYELISVAAKKKLMTLLKKDCDEKCPITMKDIKNHVSIIVSANLPNPDFDSQSKNRLISWRNREEDPPISKYDLPPAKFDFAGWNLFTILLNSIEMKKAPKEKKSLLTKRTAVMKAVDANRCTNPKERKKCTLCVTEGNSAQGYFVKMMTLMGNHGRDYYGILPLKGKGLNVMKAKDIRIMANKEIESLVQMLGLDREGKLDYSIEANFNKLRYGRLLIMTDADVDGKHVAGLIINFFCFRYPSLVKRNFLVNYLTPILRAKKGKQVKAFYSNPAFESWKAKVPDHDHWKIIYYKGLGTSEDSDVKSDLENLREVICRYDDEAESSMRLAFSMEMREERREWIAAWNEGNEKEFKDVQNISDFVNNELIQYSVSSVRRAIPKLSDGLKPSQRKIIFGVLKKFGTRRQKKDYEPIKTARLATYCAEVSHYHHGESGLADTLTKMCYSFVGSNNIPLIVSKSSIGTRERLGKDAASPRYTSVAISVLLNYIIRSEDECLLVPVMEEDSPAEPQSYYPIIPLCLINGVQGIGTGSSTFIPNFSVLDILAWIRASLEGTDPPSHGIRPWYRNFKGALRLIQPQDKSYATLISEGRFTVNKNIEITEIPLFVASNSYAKKFLGGLEAEKHISSYDYYSAENSANFVLYGWSMPQPPSLQNLNLVSSNKLTNMVLLEEDHTPLRYDSIYEIMEKFYDLRLQKYQERKDFYLQDYQTQIQRAEDRKRYITAVIDGELDIKNFREAVVMEFMTVNQLDPKLIDQVSTRELMPETIVKLDAKIRELKKARKEYSKLTPEQLWSADLDEFEAMYRKVYANELAIADLY